MSPRRPTAAQADLSPLELEVMNVVWELGECASREVIETFNRGKSPPLAPTTIRTVLANLRKKGYLAPVPTIERGFRLRPLHSRESVARRSLKQMIRGLFKGSPSQAIAYLLRDESIDEDELRQIRKLIDETKTRGRDS